jgi:hypothetical protein
VNWARTNLWLLLLLTGITQCSAAGEPQLHWIPSATNPAAVQLEVTGVAPSTLTAWREPSHKWTLAQWQSAFPVRSAKNAPAMLGTYAVEQDRLRFTPQFPLTAGVRYSAEFAPTRLPLPHAAATITTDYQLPAPAPRAATTLTHIYPSSTVLPENLLKFYLHFSGPMQRGQIYQHIHLRDAAGHTLELPFLELDEELWDPNLQRLTLFIDPGRIKREVRPLEEMGPALQQGHTYTLSIAAAWRDAQGHPLAEEATKTFSVTAPDRTPLDPKRWLLTPPATPDSPAQLNFHEALDRALALRLPQVTHANGTLIPGRSELTEDERIWKFFPDSAWTPGAYQIVVPKTLEDLAGNNIDQAFEVDLPRTSASTLITDAVKLPFQVSTPSPNPN